MDFIVKFPKSEDLVTNARYNNILIVINRLTKYAHLILYIEKFTVK